MKYYNICSRLLSLVFYIYVCLSIVDAVVNQRFKPSLGLAGIIATVRGFSDVIMCLVDCLN